jgi:uncharacterized protein
MQPKPSENVRLTPLLEHIDALSAWFDVLDASAIDGFLAAVLVQPKPVPETRWWPLVLGLDSNGGAGEVSSSDMAKGLKVAQTTLLPLVRARHAELSEAIEQRAWFDPWIFAETDDDLEDANDDGALARAIQPWVDGFALALEHFDDLSATLPKASVNEALALVYAHFDADDLDDEGLQEAIDELEPAQSLQEAVEDLVSACLLLADLTRSRPKVTAKKARALRPPGRTPRGPHRGKAKPTKVD